MSIFRVQRIRSCVSCGDVLALKCSACVKHPERKPRVLELHDWPEILKTAECGCCIQIRCQAIGCIKAMWRNMKWSPAGKSLSKRFFCSIPCASRTISASRCTKRTVPCAYCSKPVEKKSYALKTFKMSFCNNSCFFLYRAKKKHEKQEAARQQEDATDRALLYCVRCKDVEEHASAKKNARCLKCGTQRGQASTALDSGETQRLVNAGKDARWI